MTFNPVALQYAYKVSAYIWIYDLRSKPQHHVSPYEQEHICILSVLAKKPKRSI